MHILSQDCFKIKNLKMSLLVMYLVPVVLSCLSHGSGSIILINGQGQKIDIKVVDRSDIDDQECPSIERARNEIHQIIDSVIAATVALTTMPTGHMTTTHSHNYIIIMIM